MVTHFRKLIVVDRLQGRWPEMRLERQGKARSGSIWGMVFRNLNFMPRSRIVIGMGIGREVNRRLL